MYMNMNKILSNLDNSYNAKLLKRFSVLRHYNKAGPRSAVGRAPDL